MTAGAESFSDRALAEWFDAETEVRRGKVVLLRLAGMTYAAIAGELGVAVSTARKDYQIALEASTIDPEQGIARQNAMITAICRANVPAMLSGDKDAAATILKALDREAKLNGYDAPTRVLASVNNVDFSNEAAQLLDKIKSYEDQQKGLPRGRGEVIDAELAEGVGAVGQVNPGDAAPGPEGGRPGGGPDAGDGERAVNGADPDDDYDWADVDD